MLCDHLIENVCSVCFLVPCLLRVRGQEGIQFPSGSERKDFVLQPESNGKDSVPSRSQRSGGWPIPNESEGGRCVVLQIEGRRRCAREHGKGNFQLDPGF